MDPGAASASSIISRAGGALLESCPCPGCRDSFASLQISAHIKLTIALPAAESGQYTSVRMANRICGELSAQVVAFVKRMILPEGRKLSEFLSGTDQSLQGKPVGFCSALPGANFPKRRMCTTLLMKMVSKTKLDKSILFSCRLPSNECQLPQLNCRPTNAFFVRFLDELQILDALLCALQSRQGKFFKGEEPSI